MFVLIYFFKITTRKAVIILIKHTLKKNQFSSLTGGRQNEKY